MTDAQLVASILAAYSLTKQDIAKLSNAIADARLQSAQASYRSAQKAVGIKQNWTASATLQRKMQRQAVQDAQGIAETYKGLLQSFVEQALHIKKSWSDLFGNIGEAISSMVESIGQWLGDFLPWKSQQIVDASCGAGLNDGIDQFVSDNYGNTIDTESGEVVNWKDYAVQVLPGTSSSDECADYAGNVYDLSEYDSIPAFPLHPGCPHYKQIVAA